MGYCTRQEVIIALANALSQGNPVGGLGTVSPITSIGKTITDTVTDDDINQYRRWADQTIDAALSSIYRVPFKRVNCGSFQVAMDITAADTQAVLEDATGFIPDDVVLVRDDTNWQELVVASVASETTLTFTLPITNSYLAASTKIERIRYPNPLPTVSSRLTAAYLYDKFFASQVEGNESDYGKLLRQKALQEINQVLAGTIKVQIVDASDFVGRRYYNPALDDVYNTRAEPTREWYKEG